jgi:hypothetical protein
MAFRIPLHEMDGIDGMKVEMLKHGAIKPTDEQKRRYRESTGRSYERIKRASSLFLLHHERGQTFTGIQWKQSGEVVISVHGLQQYSDGQNLCDDAIQRLAALKEMLKSTNGFMLHRVDYSMDMPKIPPRIMKKLLEKRTAVPIGATLYIQPTKQRERENQTLKIMLYDKADKHSWPLSMMRLEFALKSKQWPKEIVTLGKVNNLIEAKGIKVIQRWTGEKVQVQKLIT